MRSRAYEGWVRHRRFGPVPHAFRYRMFWLYLDLAELDRVFQGRWLWSTHRPAPARFRREDHLGDPAVPLERAVRDLVEARTGSRPAGAVDLLTGPRWLGYAMNPVSFYYCHDAAGERVQAVVAEVHNTPWNERHCYVLTPEAGGGRTLRARARKAFHVSPFLPMELEYAFRFGRPGRRLGVHVENRAGGRRVFDATLALAARPLDGRTLAGALARHPFHSGKVAAAIYLQALRLWWKGAPFFPHPGRRAAGGPA